MFTSPRTRGAICPALAGCDSACVLVYIFEILGVVSCVVLAPPLGLLRLPIYLPRPDIK